MTAAEQIETTFREEHGRILAALISQFGDFTLAEDALQDALVEALDPLAARWRAAQSRRLAADGCQAPPHRPPPSRSNSGANRGSNRHGASSHRRRGTRYG